MFAYILKGGIVMYPIIFCSVISLAIILERLIYYHRITVNNRKLFRQVVTYLESGDWKSALEYCKMYKQPLANILSAGVSRFREGKEQIDKACSEAGEIEIAHLEKFLPILATIASLSTLLGFTGTVTGMIRAFNNIVEHGVSSPVIVAGGIAEALITTAAGLIVAIPTLAAYYYFTYQVNRLIWNIERYTQEIIDLR